MVLRFHMNEHSVRYMRAGPSNLVVKYSMLCFSSLGSVLEHGPTPFISGHVVAAAHIQNRGRLAEMLAQGESFPAKKKKDT